MAFYDDNVTVSFRLNLNREEDLEIHRFLNGDAMKVCYGDKSKFIKSALIRAIQGIKQEDNNKLLALELDIRRSALQETMTVEADRVINAVKEIVRDEMAQLADLSKMQIIRGMSSTSKEVEISDVESSETGACFGVVPENSGEDVSDDVMSFLEDL